MQYTLIGWLLPQTAASAISACVTIQFNMLQNSNLHIYKNGLCDISSILGNMKDKTSQRQTFIIVHFVALIAEGTTSRQKMSTRLERLDSYCKF